MTTAEKKQQLVEELRERLQESEQAALKTSELANTVSPTDPYKAQVMATMWNAAELRAMRLYAELQDAVDGKHWRLRT